jgi:hypothetical protein
LVGRKGRAMSPVIWLVLVLTTGTNATSNLLHVGNFSSKERCEAAGKGMVGTASSISYVCVQANETGKLPPP